MNRLLILNILVSLTLVFSCNEDEGDGINADLHYDGANDSAPTMMEGTYEAAAKFTTSETMNFIGKNLEQVKFYIQDKPNNCAIKIYDGAGNSPDSLLYLVYVNDQVSANSWNTHNLIESIPVTENLWISVEFELLEPKAVVGCDVGPANDNGDLTYSETDGQWFALRTRTGGSVNINWNIRGHVAN